MHFRMKEVSILTVVTTFKVGEDITDEIHIFLSDSRIPKNNANIEYCHDVIVKNIECYHCRQFQRVYEYTDGCAGQYKNRKFLGWLVDRCGDKRPLIHRVFWESGHGKSKADGAGGTLKMQLDRAVYAEQIVFDGPQTVFNYCRNKLDYDRKDGRTTRRVYR